MTKGEIRTILRLGRKKIAERPQYARLSRQMQENLLAAPAWAKAACVLAYRAVKGEAETALLLETAWAQGKAVYLPRCLPGRRGEMEFLACSATVALVLSDKGIPEPPSSAESFEMEMLPQALIMVPGLGFDSRGYRIGYGGGYYDRLLALPHGPAVGLAYQSQIVEFLPQDPWDMPVDALCTEDGLLWI